MMDDTNSRVEGKRGGGGLACVDVRAPWGNEYKRHAETNSGGGLLLETGQRMRAPPVLVDLPSFGPWNSPPCLLTCARLHSEAHSRSAWMTPFSSGPRPSIPPLELCPPPTLPSPPLLGNPPFALTFVGYLRERQRLPPTATRCPRCALVGRSTYFVILVTSTKQVEFW